VAAAADGMADTPHAPLWLNTRRRRLAAKFR